MHARPAVQATQAPPLQTMLVPHDVPFVTLPVSVHTGAPLVHTVAAVRQGFPLTVQEAPAWQAMQLPALLQTLPVPQAVPADSAVPVSLHTGAPVEHASVPLWHALDGTQDAPCWQVAHCPSRQTMPAPHEVPFGWLPLSVHTGAPVVQAMIPT